MDPKALYENLAAIHGALPDTEQERFAELASGLATYWVTEARPAQVYQTVARWRRDNGYPAYQ
jgi:hypothetical protein